jgi:vacuolar-type H+-ATPase subunit H
MTQSILDEARSKAQGEADGVKSSGAKEVAAIESNSASNQDKAVQMVVDALTSA